MRKNKKYLDYIKISEMVLWVFILAGASIFLCFLMGAPEVSSTGELSIFLQSDKNGEGCYLFLPSFAKLTDVKIKVSGEQEEDGLLLEEETFDGILVRARGQIIEAEVVQSAHMPCIWIETEKTLDELQSDKETESGGTLRLYLPDGRTAWQGEIEAMHGHGNSTWYENKKSWQIKLSEKASLLNMNPSKKWLLISNTKDPSMMRNKLFLDMAKGCGLPGALSCEWADLYVNGEYQGLYLLSEKVDIASGRLEIGNLEAENKKLNGDVAGYMNYTVAGEEETLLQGWILPENPKNIKGGYLLEMEYPIRYAGEPSKFLTRSGQNIVVKSPAYASVEQIQYIYSFVQDFESALLAKDGYLPQGEELEPGRAGISYTEMIDIDSFAGRYVLDEISKNVDANFSSMFFYKPRYADRLYGGAVWDYDLALGNNYGWGDAESLQDPEGFYVNTVGWSKALYEKPEFRDVVEKHYRKSYGPWVEEFLKNEFDIWKEQIGQAAKMDNCYRGIDTWEESTEEMCIFLEKRKKWLDEQWEDRIEK